MCVLTILPTANDTFLVTSNRDESALRPIALQPMVKLIGGQEVLMPTDPLGGGTWLATAANGRVLVLLNGAFVAHPHEPPYRKSRGLVLVDAIGSSGLEDFGATYNLDAIEPFTLTLLDLNGAVRLSELRWDGQQAHYKPLDAAQPHIWSAAKLYPPEVIEAREQRFVQWVQAQEGFTAAGAKHFHEKEKYDHEGVHQQKDNPHQLFTLSITSMQVNRDGCDLVYHDLWEGGEVRQYLAYQPPTTGVKLQT